MSTIPSTLEILAAEGSMPAIRQKLPIGLPALIIPHDILLAKL